MSLLVCGPGCAFIPKGEDDVLQGVYFATMRAPAADEDIYGNVRAKALSRGGAIVRLPDNPTLEAQAKSYAPQWLVTSFSEQDNKDLPRAGELDSPSFYESLRRYADETREGDKRVLIYLHGYKRSFSENLESIARLTYQVGYPGPTLTFSWPSRDSWTGYMADTSSARWVTPMFTQYLQDIMRELPDFKIDIIAHSMGNQILLSSLRAIKSQWEIMQTWPIGNIVMLAPDVDRDVFLMQYADIFPDLASTTTLYVSDSDFPLMASRSVNIYPRLGDSRQGATVTAGIDTVDVSDAVTMMAGHAYYRKSEAFVRELHDLLVQRKGAKDRVTLAPATNEQGAYWRLLPDVSGHD